MLGRLLTIPFGSVWELKEKCNSSFNITQKISRTIYQIYQYENCSSIAWNSKFSGEPCFPHGIKSIFISGEAEIGKNCVIFQQVTIGSVSLIGSRPNGAPSIGDNVYIGAGAKIIGAVKVGNNVRIGANAVIHTDVPDNTTVVVGEQRLITRETPLDNRFFSNRRGIRKFFHDGKWIAEQGAPKGGAR